MLSRRFMGEASGSVFEARKSAVRLYQTPLTSLLCDAHSGRSTLPGPRSRPAGPHRGRRVTPAARRAVSARRWSPRPATRARRGCPGAPRRRSGLQWSPARRSRLPWWHRGTDSPPAPAPPGRTSLRFSSNKRLKTQRPKRSRVRVRLEWSASGS